MGFHEVSGSRRIVNEGITVMSAGNIVVDGSALRARLVPDHYFVDMMLAVVAGCF
jgi:hypothetical protein